MASKRPQLSLPELYQLKWLLGGMLALISAWTVLYMDVEAWLWLVLISLAAPLVMAWPALILRVPRGVHRLAFPLLVGTFAIDLVLHVREPLSSVIRLTLMLMLYRVITPRRRRDDLQLILLGLFLVVVGGVLSVSILFAAQIVVFTACALGLLLVVTLVDAMEQGLPEEGRTTEAAWMQAGWGRLARRMRECVDWRVAVLGGLLFAGVVGLSALLFMAIPRFEISNGLFLDRMVSRKAKSGFSETVQFGDVVDIQRDTNVALSVDVSDRSQMPALPYWRMLVLDEYSQGGFRMSAALKSNLEAYREQTAQIEGDVLLRANRAVWTFYLEVGTSRFLPLLGGFNQLTFESPQSAGLNHDLRIVSLRQMPAKMLAYRVEGMQFGPTLGSADQMAGSGRQEAMGEGKVPDFLELATLTPADQAQLAAWVREINAPADNPAEFARRASAWLWRTHSYSLQSQLESVPGDPLMRWIASRQPGHCELFAGSFLLLARAAGYPTRVVLGFKGGSWNAHSENLTIRNSDAHAWDEVFDRAANLWVRVDPTPGSVAVGEPVNAAGGEATLARIRDDSWTARFDSLRVFWYRRIVSFDQGSQIALAHTTKKLVERHLREFKQALRQRFEKVKHWLQSPWDVRRVSVWTAAALALGGCFCGWRFYGRGAWLRWRSGLARNGLDPVRREAGRWLRKTAEAGLKTPEEAAVRIDLERLRYGPRQAWPEPLAVFRRAKKTIRQARRRSA